MKFKVVHIGKSKSGSASDAVKELYKRIRRYAAVEEVLIADVKNATSISPEELKRKEGEAILGKLDSKEFIILLDEKGKEMGSRAFAGYIQKHFMDIRRPMTFVVGGAFGFGEEVYRRADAELSLSKMTFSHQLIRLIFAEQLYRALTIIKGHPYHND